MRNGKLHLESIVADPDGSKLLRDSRDGKMKTPKNSATTPALPCSPAAATRSSKPSTAAAWPFLRNRDLAQVVKRKIRIRACLQACRSDRLHRRNVAFRRCVVTG